MQLLGMLTNLQGREYLQETAGKLIHLSQRKSWILTNKITCITPTIFCKYILCETS